MRFIRFTGGVAWRLALVFLAFMFISALVPQAAPQMGVAEAADGYYWRSATWWMDDSNDTFNGGQIYRVKVQLTWQTKDPSPVCYETANAAPDGTKITAFSDGIYPCPWYRTNHFYPSTNFSVVCWVSNSFLLSTGIDYCGKFGGWNWSPPYYFIYGALFHACVGVYGTIFSYCHFFKTAGYVEGSSIRIWNSTS